MRRTIAPQLRHKEIIKGAKSAKTVSQMAEELQVHHRTIQRDLAKLRKRFQADNANAFSEMRQAQLAVLEQIEDSIITGAIPANTANAWRQVRGDIAKLLGLNAESKSVVAHINADVDPSTLIGYRRFVHETQGLDASQLEKVYDFSRTLRVKQIPIEIKPPSTSPLWEEETHETN